MGMRVGERAAVDPGLGWGRVRVRLVAVAVAKGAPIAADGANVLRRVRHVVHEHRVVGVLLLGFGIRSEWSVVGSEWSVRVGVLLLLLLLRTLP